MSTIIKDDEGSDTLVYTHDGSSEQVWEVSSLAERIRKGYTKIESIPALLGMIIYQYTENNDATGIALQAFLDQQMIHYIPFVVVHEKEE